jgi:hypothetical protein
MILLFQCRGSTIYARNENERSMGEGVLRAQGCGFAEAAAELLGTGQLTASTPLSFGLAKKKPWNKLTPAARSQLHSLKDSTPSATIEIPNEEQHSTIALTMA